MRDAHQLKCATQGTMIVVPMPVTQNYKVSVKRFSSKVRFLSAECCEWNRL